MGKVGTLIKVAATAGPAVWGVVRRFGPMLERMRKDNPEVFDQIATQVQRLARSRREAKGPEGLRRRIVVLRQQLAYLDRSADDDGERVRARGWARQLDKLEASLPLLDTMSRRTSTREAHRVGDRIDALSEEILTAFIDEQRADSGPSGPVRRLEP
ncbi:MAG: hypothetical protein ACYC1Z_01300 [Georgenia sp.]